MSNSGRKEWGGQSYLDALRAAPGWRTEFAVLATYSADMVAMVAALLALAGLDDDRGSGKKVDLANALDRLKDRVRVVLQAGRLVAPAKTPKILAVLDRYVREARDDERQSSWHPKAALVKTRAEQGGAVQWALWIGSRNLTRDLSWDLGLALVGSWGGDGAKIDGIPALGAELVRRAELPRISAAKVERDLSRVHWRMPKEWSVEQVRLLLDEDRPLPDPPDSIRKLIVVSPFLDGTVVKALGGWGDERTQRTLVSTRPELAKLAAQTGRPLDRFAQLLALEAPALDADSAEAAEEEKRNDAGDEDPEPRGLHAKLVLAEHGGGRTLWFGSANVTRRGWHGPNAEIVARMRLSEEMAAGLDHFLAESGRLLQSEELQPTIEDAEQERLEEARKQVVARWVAQVTLRVEDTVIALMAGEPPHPDDAGIEMFVGLLGCTPIVWPRGELRLQLPAVSAGELTELVRIRLVLSDIADSWVQLTPMTPPLDEEGRDRAALTTFLDPRTFLEWIRSGLTEEAAGDGGGDWDEEGRGRGKKEDDRATWWAPTLEEVLRAWIRDPNSVAEADRRMHRYLDLLERRGQNVADHPDAGVLAEFRATWQVVRRVLAAGTK